MKSSDPQMLFNRRIRNLTIFYNHPVISLLVQFSNSSYKGCRRGAKGASGCILDKTIKGGV